MFSGRLKYIIKKFSATVHHHTRTSRANTQELFLPNPAGGCCMPHAGRYFLASTAAVPTATAKTASEDQPLTLPPPRSAFGGKPCGEPGYAPGPSRFQQDDVLHHAVYTVLPAQSTVLPVYIALCIQY
jgi:hypothetical protein